MSKKPYWDPDYAVGPEPDPYTWRHLMAGVLVVPLAVLVAWWLIE